MRLPFSLALVALAGAPPLEAQQTTLPGSWRVLSDAPARHVTTSMPPGTSEEYRFVTMAPGWHITTGPGALFFDPAVEGRGRYRLEAQVALFPNPSDQPLGLFVGGAGLGGEVGEARWVGLLVRRDGMAGVVRRQGGGSHPLVPFAPTDSLRPHSVRGVDRIILAVDVEADSVRFFVNGGRVAAVARAGLALDGAFGFRIGQGLDLHVTRLDYTQRFAPVP